MGRVHTGGVLLSAHKVQMPRQVHLEPFLQPASERGIFERPCKSFVLDSRVTGWVLDDPANPLNRIAHLIPAKASVLDVGTGNGILARLLQELGKPVEIDGVEPDPVARAAASPFYRIIFPGALEEYFGSPSGSEKRYDFIVLADVIEHLANPEPFLMRLKLLLSPCGSVVISTPNVAFASVRLALLNGCFDYTDSGIIERTHLRFYTLKSLKHLFAVAGLYPSAQFHCLRNPLASEIDLDDFPLTPWILARIARDKLSCVYQFLFVLHSESCAITTQVDLGNSGDRLLISYIARRVRRVIATLMLQIRAVAKRR